MIYIYYLGTTLAVIGIGHSLKVYYDILRNNMKLLKKENETLKDNVRTSVTISRPNKYGGAFLDNDVRHITLRNDKKLYAYSYPRAQLAADLVIYCPATKKMGFIVRDMPPYQSHMAFVGGFADIFRGENIDKAALRELQEESNIELSDLLVPRVDLANHETTELERLTFRASGDRDSRGYTSTMVYLLKVNEKDSVKAEAGDDARDFIWIPISKLKQLIERDNNKSDDADVTEDSITPWAKIEDIESEDDEEVDPCLDMMEFAFDHFEILKEVFQKYTLPDE